MRKKALILGASGLVGRELLALLLKDERYEAVVALVRTPLQVSHPKLFQVVVQFENLESEAMNFRVHHVYSCLGTTLKEAKTKSAFRRCDYHYVVKAAQISKQQGVEHFLAVSSVGADPYARFFYLQVKGEMERDVFEYGPALVTFIRPSLLIGQRSHELGKRPMEHVSLKLLLPISRLMLGPLKKYRPIEASEVAKLLHSKAFGGSSNDSFCPMISLAHSKA